MIPLTKPDPHRALQRKMTAALIVGLVTAFATAGVAHAQATGAARFKLSGVVTDCVVPRISEAAPADTPAEVGPSGGEVISDEEAIAAYRCAKADMVAAYAKTGDPHARDYIDWETFSTTPYVSATHGNRYVMNYANAVGAEEYGKFEEGTELPPGSVLAKDSFVVNARGEVVINSLSLMEKMEAGFNPDFGDWRYTMILPSGVTVGTTKGAGSAHVAFCAGCHVAVDETQGSMFFVPKRYRRRLPQGGR